MAATGENELPPADPDPANPQSETRPRKRRRRTVACTQCRTRKLKCDREYPTCGRCLKSRVPERCTYEDSFVWQQPNTVNAATTITASASPNGGGGGTERLNNNNHIQLPPPSHVQTGASSSYPTVLPAYPKSVAAAPPPQLATPTQSSYTSSRIHLTSASDLRQSGTSRARFLDTVLDGPNPPANSNWPRISDGDAGQPGHSHSHYHGSGYEHALASPSQRLEIPNKVMIRGKETRTRFNGGGIISNLMLQVCQQTMVSLDL